MAEDELQRERLYLARGDHEVYVDTVVLPQHQLDGIRFLYQQFVKKKPGVVLNDPPGYGKRVQTVLFISAIRPLLKLPILILCDEGQELLWEHMFQTWTEMGSEISIQRGSSVAINPVCHISILPYLKSCERRDWSIVVVDEHHTSIKILNSKIKGDYRIWITSNDMKERLPAFACIYMWLYPKEKFSNEDFQGTNNSPTMALAKSARLDAFLEDVVIRRRGVAVPLGKRDETVYQAQASRKNKDATGKKIKRSKLSHEDDIKSCSEPPVKVSSQAAKNGDTKDKEATDEYFEVFAKNKQTEMDIDVGDKELTADASIEHANRLANDLTDKKKIDDEKRSVERDVDHISDDGQPPKSIDINNDIYDSSFQLMSNDEINSQNITIKYDSDTPDEDEIENYNLKMNNDIKNKIKSNESDSIYLKDGLSNDNKSDKTVIHDSIEPKEITDKADTKNNEIQSEGQFSKVIPSIEVKNEIVVIKTNDINRNMNEIVNINNVSENNETEVKLEGVELKMKQMQELAMKKFKGSFLDKMF